MSLFGFRRVGIRENFLYFNIGKWEFVINTVESHLLEVLGTRDFISKYRKFELCRG